MRLVLLVKLIWYREAGLYTFSVAVERSQELIDTADSSV